MPRSVHLSARRIRTALLAVFILLASSTVRGDEPAVPPDHAERMKEGLQIFREHVRPALVAHCLDCHGGEMTKADLDLGTREALLASGMVDDTAAASHLYAVITHEAEPHMPQNGDKLPDDLLAHFARWIDLGAPYDQPLVEPSEKSHTATTGPTDAERSFWSFQPLRPLAPPAVEDPAWARTPIDRFVLARLGQRGLHPNSSADRRRLIRRAYFDLVGLPPTPEQIDAFVADPDPEAYGKLIDRLLESPHYGERWARHWMDVARFAESHGYEQDYDRPHAYHYRDFLIQALNADMPYDQFVRWQIAGDELAPQQPLAMMATGFLGAGAFPTQLTEAEFESARYDELDDMVNTLGTAVLGLSIGCARCHDHKFDPIPAADYYRLASVFTKTIRSEIPLDLAAEENRQRQQQYEQRAGELRLAVQQYEQEVLPGLLTTWLQSDEARHLPRDVWQPLTIEKIESSAGTVFVPQPDGSYLATGTPPTGEVLTIVATTTSPLAALRVEALHDASLPQQGPGRAANGNFVLGTFSALAEPLSGGKPAAVPFSGARATHQQNDSSLSVAASLDDDPATGWAVDQGGIGQDQAAVFDTAQPLQFEGGLRLRLTLSSEHPNGQHTLGRLRLSASAQPQAPPRSEAFDPALVAAIEALQTHADPASEAWKKVLPWFAARQARWQELHKALVDHEAAGPGLQWTTVQVTAEGYTPMKHHADDRGFPHFYPDTYQLLRGDVHQKQQVAEPGYLAVLMPPGYDKQHWAQTPPSEWQRSRFERASLAAWLTDVEHGAGSLAARVMVNRLWQHHFGRGIVATPSDFGFQGERPTHPELLEWLAVDFVQHGWQIKRMHKQIMTSAVYMQDGTFDEARASEDRENTLLWRRSPRRLEAEAIRDAMLHVSGLLDATMFGPGTLDENMPRRSIYFFIKRSKLIPGMMLFDWPEHLVGIGQRATTTTAPQALLFMNNPSARQYAEGLAARLPTAAPREAVVAAYRYAFGRLPSEREQQLAIAFVEAQQARYSEMHAGDGALPRQLAWTDFCQALLSMNEFIYIE